MATDSTSTSRATARPSSSTSDAGVLLGGIFARGGAAEAVGDAAFVQAMLDVEVAHARAVLPAADADRVAAAALLDQFDVVSLSVEAARHATPVIGLVNALRAASGVEEVHAGLTSQDVIDTALMVVSQRARQAILDDANAIVDALAETAEDLRASPVLARTLMQPARATTFGLKAAGWMTAVDEAAGALADVELAVQVGGAVGASTGSAAAVAGALGLAEPVLPWHADRRRPVQLAAALGVLAGAVGKVAGDVVLLAQGEVAEVRDRLSGGSSAMPHKANPVAAISTRACAQRVPGLVATMLSSMDGEHERAAGAWQGEWETLRELLRSTGSAVAWCRALWDRIEIDADRMATNLVAVLGADAATPPPEADMLIDRALAALRAR